MIQFSRVETGLADREDLAAWIEINGNRIDEMNDSKKGIGCWYNTLEPVKNSKEKNEPKLYIRQSFIYDEVKGNVWEIYSDRGPVAYGTDEANTLIQYALKQWKRLVKKNSNN